MDDKKETEKIITQNQATESLENPFIQLAPEVVAHILSFLNDIPSRMSAGCVCHLWRKLVDWKVVKQLQLTFGPQLHINEVPFKPSKFSTALESFLPKVKLTSLQVLLPSQPPSKPSKPGLYLTWPLYLLDCGVTVNELTNQQAASLSHITHVGISGRPDNPEFEFVCHLLELCPSLTHLSIKLNSNKFHPGLLKSALHKKKLVELNINISHLTGCCSSYLLAQLCQVLAPGTLKSLAFDIGGKDATDDPDVVFVFPVFCQALQTNAGCVSALEHLTIATPRLNLGMHSDDQNEEVAFMSQVPSLVNIALPKLQVLEFTIPAGNSADHWLLLQSALMLLSDKFDHPLHVSLSTSHCMVFDLYADLKFSFNVNNPLYSLEAQVTEQEFNCTNMRWANGEVAPIEVAFKRLPPVGPSACGCDVCLLEYGLVKQQLINRLNGKASKDQLRVFVCQIPYLAADLIDQFPSLCVSQVQNGSVKIKTEGKSEFKAAVIQENSLYRTDFCAGCVMLPYPQ